MKLELIAKVIEDANLGVIGQTIFVNSMPAEVQKGVVLKNPLAGIDISPYLPGYYRGRLQAIVRAPTHEDGDNLAELVGRSLKMFNREFRDTDGSLLLKVNHIFPAQLPIVYPHTPSRSIEWSLNYVTSYVQPE